MSAKLEEVKLAEYASFDVLRFVLASAVMLSHMGVFAWENAGNLAVQVFFALSGWLIGGILYKTPAHELSSFYFNRVTRIWIPYCAAAALLYAVSWMHEPRSGRWFEFLIYDLTFTHNWFTLNPDPSVALAQMPLHGTGNHFWSLAVEEQFYLVSPLLITLVPIGRKIGAWLCIAAAACASGSQYGAISLGVLAVVLSNRFPNWHLEGTSRAILVLSAVATSILMAQDSLYEYVAPVFAVSVVVLLAAPMRRTAVTRWLGGVSFPFYLNAWLGVFAFHMITKKLGWGGNWWGVEFLFGLAISAVTYHLIDVRIMARRGEFYRPALGWALGAAGYVLVVSGLGFGLAKVLGD